MVFVILFFGCSIPLYNSYLLLGYSTYYTFLPVFILVMDKDLKND